MTKGKPFPLLVRFGIPLMLTSMLRQIYTLCDGVIVSRLLGLEAFAAIGAAAFVAMLPQSMVLGLSQGFEVVFARLYGAGDKEGFRQGKCRAAILLLAGSLAVSVLLILLRVPLLKLLRTPPELLQLSGDYLLVIYSGLSIQAMVDWSASVLRASGDSSTPLRALLISSVINVILDLVLICWIPMGVKGAALATVTAQLVSLCICLRAMRAIPQRFPELGRGEEDGSVRQLLYMGLPPMLRDGIIAVGGLYVQSVINTFGVALVAGMTAAGIYFSALIMAGDAIEGSSATFVGQNTGARCYDRIRSGTNTAAVLAIGCSLLLATAAWIFAPWLVGLITGKSDVEALAMGIHALRCTALFLPFLYLLCMYRAVLQGLGDSVTPMLSGIMELAMRLICVIVLPAFLSYTAVCIAEGVGWFAAAILLIGRYFARIRKLTAEHMK